MKARCSKCGTEKDCAIAQPSDLGGWQDYEIWCCGSYEMVAYLSRDNVIVHIPPESRRVAGMRPAGSA